MDIFWHLNFLLQKNIFCFALIFVRHFAANNERNHSRYIPYVQLLPFNLHSVTHSLVKKSPLTGNEELDKNSDLVRVQSYSPTMRSVHGFNGIQKVGQELMDIRTLVKEVSNAKQSYLSLDEASQKTRRWIELAKGHIDRLREKNGMARLELTFLSRSLTSDKVIEKGLTTLIKTFVASTKIYSGLFIAELAEISLQAFQGISNSLFMWFRGDAIRINRDWNVFAEVWQYLTFVATNFFSGRRSYDSRAYFTPRLGYLFSRPFINPTWEGINLALCKTCYNEDGLWQLKSMWYKEGEISVENQENIRQINSRIIRLSAQFNTKFKAFIELMGTKCDSAPDSLNDAVACRRCKKITSKSMGKSKSWKSHLCSAGDDEAVTNMDLKSQDFKTYLLNESKKLSASQREAAEAILCHDKSCFLTGVAGSGKSFLLRCMYPSLILMHGYASVCITATTNIAATNVNGITIHKFMGLVVSDFMKKILTYGCQTLAVHIDLHIKKLQKDDEEIIQRAQLCKVLIIDEAGMCDTALFDVLELFLRLIKDSKARFGGVRIILVGDVLQLPPIVDEKDKSSKRFFFESKSFEDYFFVAYLRENHRQSDVTFLEALNKVRIGDPTVLQYLNETLFLNNNTSQMTLDMASGKCQILTDSQYKVKKRVKCGYIMECRSSKEYFDGSEFTARYNKAPDTGYSDLIVCLEHKERDAYTDMRTKNIATYENGSIGTHFSKIEPKLLYSLNNKLPPRLKVYIGMRCKITCKTENPNIVTNTLVIITEIDVKKNVVQRIRVKTTSNDHTPVYADLEPITIREVGEDGKEVHRTQFGIIPAIGVLPWSLQCLTISENVFYDNSYSSGGQRCHKGVLYSIMSRVKSSKQLSFLFKFTEEEISNGINIVAKTFDDKYRQKSDVIFHL